MVGLGEGRVGRLRLGAAVLLIFVIQLLPVIQSTATLKLTFISYRNLGSYDIDGNSCDHVLYRECDNVFDICLDIPHGNDHATSCAFFQQTTGEFTNNDNITFGQDMMGVKNPIIINMHSWQGVKLKVRVIDDDSHRLFSAQDDLVDNLYTVHTNLPGTNGTYNQPTTDVIRSATSRKRPTSLTVVFQVKCDVTFYGPNCTTLCVPQDDGVTGHYTCDVMGNKVCLPGWTNVTSNCSEALVGCQGNPCENGATCEETGELYVCLCRQGFTGVHCETPLDMCSPNPCLNGGSCHGDGQCRCLDVFEGGRCERHVPAYGCVSCDNGGSCVADRCICKPGTHGSRCEVDLCDHIQCGPGGTCQDGRCHCPPGLTGMYCQSTTSDNNTPNTTTPVVVTRCDNGGALINGKCFCPSGTAGVMCEVRACDFIRCSNAGTCNSGWCLCPRGFSGALCEVNITVIQAGQQVVMCSNNAPCKNGGNCSALDHKCICPKGYLGDNCEVDLCNHITCYNGGGCLAGSCSCAAEFTGLYCQDAVNTRCPLYYYGEDCGTYCKPKDNNQGHYRCDAYGNKICLHGWEDESTDCTVTADDCPGHQCQNGASCQDLHQTYTCICQPGYTGTYCEIEVDECLSSPCHNGATCRNLVARYECACPPGYPGYLSPTCSRHVCTHANPCHNGGTCYDNGQCLCPTGYIGDRCETSSCGAPCIHCLHGGTCSSGTCLCRRGFYGHSCDVMLCDVIPCRNGGTCSDGRCECPSGLTGAFCEQVTGDCASQPCVNGGTCVQDGGAYTCVCPRDFRGRHCQYRKFDDDGGDVLPVAGTDGDPVCTTSKSQGLSPVVLGLLLGSILILLLLLLLLLGCRMTRSWRRRENKAQTNRPTANFTNPTYDVTTARHQRRHSRGVTSSDAQGSLRAGPKTFSMVNDGLWDLTKDMAPYFGRQVSTQWSPSGAVDYCRAPPQYDDVTPKTSCREGALEEPLEEGVDHKDFEMGGRGGGLEEMGEGEYADLDEVAEVKVPL